MTPQAISPTKEKKQMIGSCEHRNLEEMVNENIEYNSRNSFRCAIIKFNKIRHIANNSNTDQVSRALDQTNGKSGRNCTRRESKALWST